MKNKKNIEKKFNEFIETGILDNNEFQEYEACIIYFDNIQKETLKQK